MSIELESMSVEMPEVKGHPNRVAFRGVLTVVDVPSDRAPSGSGGKRVLLTRRAAEAAIPSLIGMGVDYAPALDRHDAQRKVGVITRAEVVGRDLEVSGHLFAKDFPDIVEEIGRLGRRPVEAGRQTPGVMGQASDIVRRTSDQNSASALRLSASENAHSSRGSGQALWQNRPDPSTSLKSAVKEIRRIVHAARTGLRRQEGAVSLRAETPLVLMGAAGAGSLGMSFEVTKVNVLNPRARVWKLIKVTFTGAAILRKDKAAFRDTWIELG
jgi:hypothetical protein